MNFSPYQFSFFRIILGLYLLIHFIMLIPYGTELWSDAGVFNNPSFNFTYGLFPNVLNIYDSSFHIIIFLSILCVLALLFTLGVQRNIIALLLWYGWACLFNRNNLISNPGLPYVGWLLLACAAIPTGEPLSFFKKRKEDWKLPKLIWFGAWAIMSIGYTVSGIDKLNAPSWVNGTAVVHLLNNPLARDWFIRDLFLSFPEGVLYFMSWSIITMEIIFLPLAIFRKTRVFSWLGMVFMHLGILLLVDFADLTAGMLMIHLFTFDPRWIKAKKYKEQPVIFFDGVCGLCNSFVDVILQEDKENTFKYSPLQGETAKVKIPDFTDYSTVVLYTEKKVYTKSTAALKIISSLGGFWAVASVFFIFPRFFRDAVYNFIATNRYKWFGKKESCRIPTKEEREKFLN